ncbi:uncharacterized protein LOC128348149 isoform X1 [Hemicordylus capensis]|uniref:uncharacterized protein LOC128348149 isoform X1 n=1 Tax=Hemicordylus capensis TaxID=884348 RepID=UPI002304A430|nr:uncharacterized protein LOC128348149 isoform X1 [Hemicordylus capensis]
MWALASSPRVGGEGGRRAFARPKELHATALLIYSRWAPSKAVLTTRRKAACRGFRNSSNQQASRCRRVEAILFQPTHGCQAVGTPLELSRHGSYSQGFKASLIRHQPCSLCQGLGDWLTTSQYCHQGAGAPSSHSRHRNQCQALNNHFAHPQSQWQSLNARPRHRLFLRAQSRHYSRTSVAGQRCPFLPWGSQRLAAFAPANRVGTYRDRATSVPVGTECHVVDLRSDAVTRPSLEMRQAMAQAEVGHDDYDEDPTVKELQSVVADLLGMEAALFVPSATMANLIAVMCHCRRRGAQLLLGRESHIHVFEHGGVAQVAGVHSEILQDLPDGLLSLDELEHKIQQSHASRYHPHPELICLENTHCSAGGRVLPLKYLQQVHQLAQQYGMRIHMDGARVLNAAVALGVLPTCISQHCDSISLCVSKGVGAPSGALLAGSRELITEAWRVRKLLGGGMCQAGVLAAAALVGLSRVEETLQRDHDNARRFAQGICEHGSPLCSINPALVETNIVMVTVLAQWLSPAKLCELMEAVTVEEVAATGQAISVQLFPWGKRCLRAVWHSDISTHDTQRVEKKWRFVLDKCEQEHAGTL